MGKYTSKDIARFKAIRAAKAKTATNDNSAKRSIYVDTTMTPGMLRACVEAAGLVAA